MEAAVCVACQRMTEKPSGDGMEGGSKINKSNDLNITLNYNYYKYFPLSKLPSNHTIFHKSSVQIRKSPLIFWYSVCIAIKVVVCNRLQQSHMTR
jgi:hypothetical protein